MGYAVCSRGRLKRGTSFIDVLVGVSILLLVFLGIFGVFQLATRVIGNGKAKVGAAALATDHIEYMRSLAYDNVGTTGGIPSGLIPQEETIFLNNISYIRRTFVQYVDASEDGEGESDENGITTDYKVVKVVVLWALPNGAERSVTLVSNIVPKGIETVAGGGTLVINVLNALGTPLSGATVHIENTNTVPAVDVFTTSNAEGRVTFPGSPAAGSYEVTVSKSGYSTAQTYDATVGNPNPTPGHLTVVEGAVTTASFQIDTLGTLAFIAQLPIGPASTTDSFASNTNLAVETNTEVLGGAVVLIDGGEGYVSAGATQSVTHAPENLVSWDTFSWSDAVPAGTSILYHISYEESPGVFAFVPDADLPGNETGFLSGPVDLSALSPTLYPELRLDAELTSSDSSVTPEVLSWALAYQAGPTPLAGVTLGVQGAKTIGVDDEGSPIYKFTTTGQTDSSGRLALSGVEWDTYGTIFDDTAEEYDIMSVCAPTPYGLAPGESAMITVTLTPDTAHSLRVVVQNDSGVLVQNATVRLYRAGYDTVKTSDACGQVFYGGLSRGTVAEGDAYALDVSASGYEAFTISTLDVDGVAEITTTLQSL